VSKFINTAECPQSIENIHNYIQTFEKNMPKLHGAKAHALSGLIRDMPESNPSSQSKVIQLMEASALAQDQNQSAGKTSVTRPFKYA